MKIPLLLVQSSSPLVAASCSSMLSHLCETSNGRFLSLCRGNAHRASLGKIAREEYLRRYPVKLIRPDGSTITIRCAEPRQTVQLAVDLKVYNEAEQRERIAARKPKAKQLKQEKLEVTFDPASYIRFAQTPPSSASSTMENLKVASSTSSDNKSKSRQQQRT